jgi:hypothetical protein
MMTEISINGVLPFEGELTRHARSARRCAATSPIDDRICAAWIADGLSDGAVAQGSGALAAEQEPGSKEKIFMTLRNVQ